MNPKDEPAFPVRVAEPFGQGYLAVGGLTKYEHAALTLMAALISSGQFGASGMAEASFNAADAYFAELERRNGGKE